MAASSVQRSSPEKLAKRLLKYLQMDGEHEKINKFMDTAGDTNEVYEQLRIQSDQFASIYPLLERATCIHHRFQLLIILTSCSLSSVSANLLAKENRVWGFLVALLEADFGKENQCWVASVLFGLIVCLLQYVNKPTWKFALQSGLLEHLLAEMQKKPRTCTAQQVLYVIGSALQIRKTQRRSIDTLVSGGFFTVLEQLMQKSGNLLKGTPPCSECKSLACDFPNKEDFNWFGLHFLGVNSKT